MLIRGGFGLEGGNRGGGCNDFGCWIYLITAFYSVADTGLSHKLRCLGAVCSITTFIKAPCCRCL